MSCRRGGWGLTNVARRIYLHGCFSFFKDLVFIIFNCVHVCVVCTRGKVLAKFREGVGSPGAEVTGGLFVSAQERY